MGIGGFIVKKIPIAGLFYGVGSGVYHAVKGDYGGAVMDVAAGVTSLVPGLGTGISIGLDVVHAGADYFDSKIIPELKPYSVYIDSWEKHLKSSWKLSGELAHLAAQLIVYASLVNLNPVVTSGYRSQAQQDDLIRRYNAGEPGIYKPSATVGKHGTTDGLGRPAAKAVDISTNFPAQAASIGKYLGLKTGYDYGDPVHFNL